MGRSSVYWETSGGLLEAILNPLYSMCFNERPRGPVYSGALSEGGGGGRLLRRFRVTEGKGGQIMKAHFVSPFWHGN